VAEPIPEVVSRSGTAHGAAVQSMFDSLAPTYDRLNRVLSLGIDQSWRKEAIRELYAGEHDRVLDLCSGTMDLARALQKQNPARLVAADFAAEMLEAGKHKAPRAERVVADATKMPFADAEFTRVICGFGMRNLQDVAKGIEEVRRVLAPRGRFVTLEFFKPTRLDTRVFHAAYGRYVLPTVGALVSRQRAAYTYLRDSMKAFYTIEEYGAMVQARGFVHVRTQPLLFGIAGLVIGEVPG
jgi:ubiquinone/menaquinone biosynthesis methyltransferase